jgi:hypothetical protein
MRAKSINKQIIIFFHFALLSGPISVEHYQEVDVEVDVEQCSDSEEPSRTPRKSRKTSTQTPSDDERLTPEPASVSFTSDRQFFLSQI